MTRTIRKTTTVTTTFHPNNLTAIIFNDLNNNGVYDLGVDTPLGGVPFALIKAPAGGTTALSVTTTVGPRRRRFARAACPDYLATAISALTGAISFGFGPVPGVTSLW